MSQLKLTLVIAKNAPSRLFLPNGTEITSVVDFRVNNEDPASPRVVIELANVHIDLVIDGDHL